MTAADYTRVSIASTEKDFEHIMQALAHLPEHEVWRRPNAVSNSIGNLLLHLSGSHRFWIVSVVGRQPSARVRQAEFDAAGGQSKAELLAALRQTVDDANAVLQQVNDTDLLETREAFGRTWTTLEAIQHTVVHFSLHTGQILLLVKILTGVDLALPR